MGMACAIVLFCPSPRLFAQVSFESSLALALQNSARIKMAEDDVNRSKASLSESKDVYIPTFGLGGGLGRSYGITLTVPTIFTVNSQSLIYSPAQRSYTRAARDGLRAASLGLQDVREQIEEDTALTYTTLDEANARRDVLASELEMATKLFDITQQRAAVGLDSDLDVQRSKRTLLQIQLQQPQVNNDIAGLQEHLSQLTGLPGPLSVISTSIPVTRPTLPLARAVSHVSAGVLSSQANALSRADSADGDRRFAFRPQISMQAQYGRVSPINNVSEYYNLNGQYNTMIFGVAIQLPLLDRAHAARARANAAEALHAQHEAQLIEGQQRENELRLQNSLSELEIRAELAKVDWNIARDELEAVVSEVKTRSLDVTGGRQLTPKDELNSRLAEAQRHLDWLDADLQLYRTQITVSRLNGTLEQWLTCAKTPHGCSSPTEPLSQ